MKSAVRIVGALLCICSIATAQQPASNGVGTTGNTIPVLSGCLPMAVTVFGFWKSRQKPQITVKWNGQPLGGASVEVYRGVGPEGERLTTTPVVVLTSDADGHVVLPQLPRGKYYVRGRSKPDREDNLYLELTPLGRRWPNLELNLSPSPGSAESVLEYVGAISHAIRVSAFRGVVEFGGKVVPNANIHLFVMGRGIDQQAIDLRADSNGEFSAQLPDGRYAAYIWKDGYGTDHMFEVDISRTAASAGLQVGLCQEITQ